ncbi:glucosamine-6-phosphate deaminase [bacterium]|nr:glucosamine-6-phosphate deaminase [bacterium]
MKQYNNLSKIENIAITKFGKQLVYPPYERIKTLEIPNIPTLGKITALRFIEWLQINQGGIISLPTGKTPEHFIKWTKYFLSGWQKREVAKELEEWHIDTSKKPDIKSFWLVQIDEFYPMDPQKENSFNHYIKNFYIKLFGFDPKKCLLMDTWTQGVPKGKNLGDIFPDGKADLSLRHRSPKNQLETQQQAAIFCIDRFAMEYEKKIEALGGIGFFLGGIGPDGHIAFNIKGSDHNSTTRVLNINYETAAASAVDMGGIELSRNKAVVTIGLSTITKNPTVTSIIMAAGESKSSVIKNSIEEKPSILHPASSLQQIEGARFYITSGAASMLTGRRIERLQQYNNIPSSEKERIITDITAKLNTGIQDISIKDVQQDTYGSILLKKETDFNFSDFTKSIVDNYGERIERGVQEVKNATFLHTAPHHDDIMLGYLPYILHLVRQPTNAHRFVTLTSGFTSISNTYTLSMLLNLEDFIKTGRLNKILSEEDYFSPNNIVAKNRDVYQYLDGVAASNEEMKQEGSARRMYRNIVEVCEIYNKTSILKKTETLKKYFIDSYPGRKDTSEVQKLKGTIREWEEELLWAHLGFNCDNIYHLRLGFYTGDIFTPTLQWQRDIKPFFSLLEKLQPDIVTVAFDPEGTGPDTHYKVLQIISDGLQKYVTKTKKRLKIWGYRNVWHRFHPSESNIYVPVSMNSLAIMKSAFDICFTSQKNASFPSYEYDGSFAELSQKIFIEQGLAVKKILGRDFFETSKFARIRASRGINFIKEMDIEEFLYEAQNLRKAIE